MAKYCGILKWGITVDPEEETTNFQDEETDQYGEAGDEVYEYDDQDGNKDGEEGGDEMGNGSVEDHANQETTPQVEKDQSNTPEQDDSNDASPPSAELPQSEKSEDASNNNNPSNTNDGGNPPANAPPPQAPQPQPSALSNTNDGGSPPANAPPPQAGQHPPSALSNTNDGGSPPANSTAYAPPPPPPQQTQSQPKPGSDTPSEQGKLQQQQGQGQRQREWPNNEKVGEQEKAPSRIQSGGGGGSDLPTPEEDSISLNRAFKGSGCDVGKIMEILSNRGASHLELVKQHYKKTYEEELSDRLSSELSSLGKGDIKEKFGFDLALSTTLSLKFSNDLKRALSLWILDESERDATIVWQGLSVASVNLEAVTEVICSRTPSQLRSLKRAYFSLHSSQLLDDIKSNVPLMVSPTHKQLLIACLDDKRDGGKNVNDKMVEDDAKQLYKDGEQIWGTNESTFIDIFTQRNGPHLAAVDAKYNELYGHSLQKAVKKETSRYLLKGLLILLKCAMNSGKFFAEVLHEAVGTSNTKLIRVVVTRADIDMEEIKKEYYLAYNVSLMDAIHKKTSGHYRTFLINLVNRSKGASAKRL